MLIGDDWNVYLEPVRTSNSDFRGNAYEAARNVAVTVQAQKVMRNTYLLCSCWAASASSDGTMNIGCNRCDFGIERGCRCRQPVLFRA